MIKDLTIQQVAKSELKISFRPPISLNNIDIIYFIEIINPDTSITTIQSNITVPVINVNFCLRSNITVTPSNAAGPGQSYTEMVQLQMGMCT